MTHKEARKLGKFYFKMCKFRKTKEPIDINGVNVDNVMKNIDKKNEKNEAFDGYGKYSNKNMKSFLNMKSFKWICSKICKIKAYAIYS